jgi:hypothetical protein
VACPGRSQTSCSTTSRCRSRTCEARSKQVFVCCSNPGRHHSAYVSPSWLLHGPAPSRIRDSGFCRLTAPSQGWLTVLGRPAALKATSISRLRCLETFRNRRPVAARVSAVIQRPDEDGQLAAETGTGPGPALYHPWRDLVCGSRPVHCGVDLLGPSNGRLIRMAVSRGLGRPPLSLDFAGCQVKAARLKRIGPPGIEARRLGKRCATGRTTEIVFT